MGAILASFGAKDYAIAGLVTALIAAAVAFVAYERHEAAHEALIPVAVLAHKAEIKVAVGTAIAESTEKDNAKTYDAAVRQHDSAPIGIVCYNARSGAVPEADAIVAPGVGDLTSDSGEGSAYDPSGATLQRAAEADAQIAYLQGRIAELETQMKGSP